MANSGVAIASEVANECRAMQLDRKYRYLIFHIAKNLTEVCILKAAPREAEYKEFLEDMKHAECEKECRFAVYDYEFSTESGNKKDKIVFYSWCPDGSKVKQKMVYTSTKESLKKALNLNVINIQATDDDEISEEYVIKKIKETDKA